MKTKRYPHVTGLYGDSGENPGALAVHAVLDPSPNYPENGRIIVGSPATTPTIPGHIPNLGGFNGGPAAIEQLAATLNEAARDVRHVMAADEDKPHGRAVKLDLDDLERKARAISDWDEERDAPEQECVACKGSMHTPSELEPTALCDHCAQAYAETTAPVVLALIARIRALEAAGREVADAPHKHMQQQRIGILRAVLRHGTVQR